MKDISKLSTREIEQKIDSLSERSQTLKSIIKEIKSRAAKDELEIQQTNYKLMIDRLRKELSKRYGALNDKKNRH
jgi:hypothetical protein